MAENVERLAEKLGAELKGTVPDHSAGAFGVAALAKALRERLEPSIGQRPARTTSPDWTCRTKVSMAPKAEARLHELADMLGDERRKFSGLSRGEWLETLQGNGPGQNSAASRRSGSRLHLRRQSVVPLNRAPARPGLGRS